MTPADEGFRTACDSFAQIDLGLIPDDELAEL